MMNGKIKKRALTRDYLVRATYNYLQRFATTERNLRKVLDRKVRRRLEEGDAAEKYAEAMVWIEDIVQKAIQQNLVNDRSFAEARGASLIRSGTSKMMASQKLLIKGVAPDLVAEIMESLSEQHEDLDVLSALKYVRKRRFGAFSRRHDGTEVVEKELASMCRAGFSYPLGRRILKMSQEEAEEVLYDTRI